VILAASVLTAAGGGVAQADPACPTTPSDRVPGVVIQDPSCGFTPLDGSSVHAGILDGSAYRIEVPRDWNGALVMYAHGYAGTGNVVSVSDPQLRQYFVDNGYAWAASSYRQNGYNVGDGVQDTQDLMVHFSALTHDRAPRETYMSGVSMGGEITAVAIEHYPGQFTAAMPMCGVLGANHLFDYFLGATATAAALTGSDVEYPATAQAGADYTPAFQQTVQEDVMPGLGITPTPGGATPFDAGFATAAGQQWVAAVEQLSGGDRPGGPGAVAYWSSSGFGALTDVPFLFGVYPGLTGGTIGYADGNVAGNIWTIYQLDGDPALSTAELAVNEEVLRVAATNTRTTDPTRTQLPDIAGTPGIPVLSVHDIGDLFVPLKMDQIYAEQVAAHGSNLFVDRAIRGTGHCEFATSELAAGFTDLVRWAHDGTPAAGDDILDPKAVADPEFGCRFTDPAFEHTFYAPPCRTAGTSEP
jgi:hypothetical protein